MSYTPYVEPDLIKSRLKGIINFGDGGYNSFSPQAGGISVTPTELNEYQAQAEQITVRKLNSLYQIPLKSNINEGVTLSDFEVSTRYTLQGLFISRTCIAIIAYVFPQEAVKARMLKDYLQKEYDEYLSLVEKVDKASGRVYPAFEDLYWSKEYLTRQETPYMTHIACNNETAQKAKVIYKW